MYASLWLVGGGLHTPKYVVIVFNFSIYDKVAQNERTLPLVTEVSIES